jgi:type II secretory ATPase GspE/PulE/Tfp pilus assembly ATPase PilB-like protein
LICPACRGLGYKGRTGIFELLKIDDKIREALVSQPKPEVIRQLARQAGNRTLQEEGILLMAMGGTSLTELQRVLKQ